MFSIMNQTVTVTNLRLPEPDMAQVRSLAGEYGVSVNEYVKMALDFFAKFQMLGIGVVRLIGKNEKDPIWDWPNLYKRVKLKPMGLSDEDEIIYGD